MNAYVENLHAWMLTKATFGSVVVATVSTNPVVRDVAFVISIVVGLTAIAAHISTIIKNRRKG